MTVLGIDVARYQPDDYPIGGLDFVFVKATEGTSYTSPAHDAQVAHGRARGLVVGHYHFQRPGSPTAQAAYFLRHAKPSPGDMLACDWEDPGVSNADKDAFIKAVQKAQPHLRVGLYCNRSYWTTRDKTSFCGDFLWIADPSAPKAHPRVEHPWLFHQYSEAGGVDHNVGNFVDRAALRAWATGTPTPDIHEEDDMQLSDEDVQRIARQVVTGAAGMHAPGDRAVDWALSSWVQDIHAKVTALEAAPAPQIDYAKLATALIAAITKAQP